MGEIRVKAYKIAFEEIMKHKEIKGVFIHPIWESFHAKCFRRGLEGPQEHMTYFFFGYQGKEVEDLVRKYFAL